MPKEFQFPDVGEGITEGELIRWLVREGETVSEHQPVVEIETDKAVVTLPIPYSGTVLRLQGRPGEIIAVGAVLAVIGEPGDEPPAAGPSEGRPDKGSVVGELKEAPEGESIASQKAEPSSAGKGDLPVMPAVRAWAKKLDVDLSRIQGTGHGGRILKVDVERAAGQSAPTFRGPSTVEPAGPSEEIPLRGIRRASAKHLSESASRVAAVTFFDDADVTPLEDVRQKERKGAEAEGFKLTYLPFIIKATIAGLKEYPYLNASLDETRDAIILKKYYHMGIAIDTPEGLMVFVIRDADRKSILDIARGINRLGEKAVERKIEISELKGSTFTVTNYGVIGGNYGTPIINYPEVAILGLGRIADRPVVKDGAVVIRRTLPLSLTFDHRVVHGAEAARFLNSVIHHLEDPDPSRLEGK